MEKLITLYHGSEQLVEEPTFGKGKKNNDFGLGFYCTKSEDLAKEWAVSSLRNGFANRYTLDTEYLNILNLNSPDYTILNWIAVLVEHRLFSIKTPVARRAKCYLIDHFSVNVNAYDLITGYRADDSYFEQRNLCGAACKGYALGKTGGANRHQISVCIFETPL